MFMNYYFWIPINKPLSGLGWRVKHSLVINVCFFSQKCSSMSHKFFINISRQPNPERGYLWKFKNKNLWEFVAHWWTFMTKNRLNNTSRASPTPKGVYLWKFKNKNLWEFVAHWWTFMTKNRLNNTSRASPTPKGVYLWKFKNKNLWEFMAHWWAFMTKKPLTRKRK